MHDVSLIRILTEIVKDNRAEITEFLNIGGILRDISEALYSIDETLGSIEEKLNDIDMSIYLKNQK